VNVPNGVTLSENDVIKATQQELGKHESKEFITLVQIIRPIDIAAETEFINLTSEDSLNYVGDRVRYRVTVSNYGDEDERADRIQVINELPEGITVVPGSVRYVSENDNGDEIIVNIPHNISSVSSRGHSYNDNTRRLEIRLGDFRLYGGENVIVEFDVIIDASVSGTTVGPKTANVTANRVSRNSVNNIVTANVIDEGLYVE